MKKRKMKRNNGEKKKNIINKFNYKTHIFLNSKIKRIKNI